MAEAIHAWIVAHGVEAAGAVTGLLCVWLTVEENVWCWPWSIANALLYMVAFATAKLYADVGLQAVYLVLSVYGWWLWLHPGGGRAELPVTRVPVRQWALLAVVEVAGVAVLGGALSHTDAAFPWIDSSTTVASLIAQWLMTKKRLENWFVWIAADVVMIAMYAAKGLYLTSGLYVLYMILCVRGVMEWRRSAASAEALAPAATVTSPG